MRRGTVRLLCALLISVAASTDDTAIAAPPPPPPRFVSAIARELVSTPTPETFARFASLFADNLKVTVNGKDVAASKAAWLAIERTRLGKVDRFVYGYTEARDSVLIIDRFDDRSDLHCPAGHTCVFDPRYLVRAIRYEIGADHLIHGIRMVQSDGFLRTPAESASDLSRAR